MIEDYEETEAPGVNSFKTFGCKEEREGQETERAAELRLALFPFFRESLSFGFL